MSGPVRISDGSFSLFFRSFERPIYAHLWICWLCVSFMLIGASDYRYPEGDLNRPGRLIWVGGVGLLVEVVTLLMSMRYPQIRAALFERAPQKIKGRLPYMLKALAVLQAIAVSFVWL